METDEKITGKTNTIYYTEAYQPLTSLYLVPSPNISTVFNEGSSPKFALKLPIIISTSFLGVGSITCNFHRIHQLLLQHPLLVGSCPES